jgi:hypothetical protein
VDAFETTFYDSRRAYHFKFKKIYIPNGLKFFVTFQDNPDWAIHFDMKKTGLNDWAIMTSVPDWLIKFEKQLSAAINTFSHDS